MDKEETGKSYWVLGHMRENTLQSNIKKQLVSMGAYVLVVHGSRFMPKGEPDTVGCYKGRAFAMEIKTPRGRLDDIQIYRLWGWHNAGAYTGVPRSVAEAIQIVLGHTGAMHGVPADRLQPHGTIMD